MELEGLLNAMDRAAANLAKLEDVWRRAQSFIPTGPARGSHPEYDDLRRAWSDLLVGLPKIDGWTITNDLPDIDEIGQMFIDYFEISEPPIPAYEAGEQPSKDLAEYRYRLNRARRRAARERLAQLTSIIDTALPRILTGVARDSQTRLEDPPTRSPRPLMRSNDYLETPLNVGAGGATSTATCILDKDTTGTTSPSSTGPASVPTLRPAHSPTLTLSPSPTSTSAKPPPVTSLEQPPSPCRGTALMTPASNACSTTCSGAFPNTRTSNGSCRLEPRTAVAISPWTASFATAPAACATNASSSRPSTGVRDPSALLR